MATRDAGRILYRRPLGEVLHDQNESVLHKYQNFFIGDSSLRKLLHYEAAMLLANPWPGAIGFFLRRMFLPGLFRKMGGDVMLGRNLSLRYPGAISIGDRTAIDDNCLLDAKGCQEDGIEIGADVLIARDTLIQGKNGAVVIGDHSVIGSQVRLSSAGGLFIGKYVNIGSQCHIGGGRFRTNDLEAPIITQPLYTNGPL
ncbi:MAG: acyltransferase, partial [Anaerolineae bacterium]|nr:acyltransferase [Anaerolineae bacterium]